MPFTYHMLRSAVLLVSIFSISLVVIHAQPYDDHELRDLLLPPGCPAPCFMGIRPGVTTMDEAAKILEQHDWVSRITRRTSDISWEWNGGQIPLLRESRGGMMTIVQSDSRSYPKATVKTIGVFTTVPFGRLRLILGDDQNHQHFSVDELGLSGRILVYYPKLSILIDTFVQCPTNIMQDWGQFRVIEYGVADYTLLGVSCQRIF
ncbi:MAG: hypothetical protein R3E39_31270 [Anaerolineae bacterium]